MSLTDKVEESRSNADISSEADREQVTVASDDDASFASPPVIKNGPVDAVLGRHIIEGIEAQLPEFIEFSLMGENRRHLRVSSPDKLRKLKYEIKASIENLAEKRSSLPVKVLTSLCSLRDLKFFRISSLRDFKEASRIFNYFDTFIDEYIHFRMSNYGGDAGPQAILSEIRRQQKGSVARTVKIKQQTNY